MERSLETRLRPVVALLFAAAVLHSLWALSVAFHGDIMDEHSFRQTQTAYATFWLLKGGAFFAYETPLLGYPWSIPMELPVYQWIVAKATALSGVSLVTSARLVGRFFFYLSLWPLYSLFAGLRFPPLARWAGLTLYLFSPLYLYWSRTFMIESTALFFALAHSACFVSALRSGRPLHWWLALACGGLAGSVKITTAFAFYLLNVLFWAAEWKGELVRPARWKRRDAWEALLLGLLLPGLLSLAWVRYSDAVKVENPFADFLTAESLREWNFGTWAQRVAGSTWYMLFRKTLRDAIGHRTAWILSVLLAPLLPRRERWAYCVASLLFVVPPMVFTNLHIAHNYYWCANGIFLLAALTATLAGLWKRSEGRAVFGWVFAVFFVLVCFYEAKAYREFPYYWQQEVNDGPRQLGERVRALTKPDDVLWVSGAGWYPAVVYYTERRSLMDPKSYGPEDPRVTAAVERTAKAGYHLALFLVCLEGAGQRKYFAAAGKTVDLEPENLGKGTICEIYRIRGLRKNARAAAAEGASAAAQDPHPGQAQELPRG